MKGDCYMANSYDLQQVIDTLKDKDNNVIVFSNVTINNLQLGDNCHIILKDCTIGNLICEEVDELEMD